MDIAKLVFNIYSSADRLDKLGNDKDKDDVDLETKISMCITLLTLSLFHNYLESLEYL